MIRLLIAGVIMWCSFGHAATYFVDSTYGDDGNPGSSSAPWQSLARAYTWYGGTGAKVQEGDTVLFRNGRYGEFSESTRQASGINWLFFRNDWITYKADTGHSPILDNVLIHNLDEWGDIEIGRSYLVFDGFEIEEGIALNHGGYIIIRNCTIRGPLLDYEGAFAPYCPSRSCCVDIQNLCNVTVENCDLSYACLPVYTKNAKDIIIKGNDIHRIGGDGINYNATHNLTIDGNTVYDNIQFRAPVNVYGVFATTFQEGEAVLQEGTGARGIFYKYEGNYIQVLQTDTVEFVNQAGGGGTVTGQNSGTTITPTKVDAVHRDGIETHSAENIRVAIRNNVVHSEMTQGITVYGYSGTRHVTLENNLVYGPDKGLVLQGIDSLWLYNNTVMDGYVRLQVIREYPGTMTVLGMYNNIFEELRQNTDLPACFITVVSHGNNIFGNNPPEDDDAGGPAYPFIIDQSESVNTIPEFVDAANKDFRLTEGSVAVGFADPEYAPATDIMGNTRDAQPDAGCYEYAASGIPTAWQAAAANEARYVFPNPVTAEEMNKILATVPARLVRLSGRPVGPAHHISRGIYLLVPSGGASAGRSIVIR